MKSFKTKFLGLIFLTLLPFQILAGNGIERGRVLMPMDLDINREITLFMNKKIKVCIKDLSTNTFKIVKFESEEDQVDQGVIDQYYKFDLLQINEQGQEINEISIQIEDMDYSNWKLYEEKLSIEFLKDKNKLCN